MRTSLEVSSGDYMGYWETRGWTPEAKVKMTSRIDLPSDGAVLTSNKPIDTGISNVEIASK